MVVYGIVVGGVNPIGTVLIINLGDSLQLSQPTDCRAIHRVSVSLSRKWNGFLHVPNNADDEYMKDD